MKLMSIQWKTTSTEENLNGIFIPCSFRDHLIEILSKGLDQLKKSDVFCKTRWWVGTTCLNLFFKSKYFYFRLHLNRDELLNIQQSTFEITLLLTAELNSFLWRCLNCQLKYLIGWDPGKLESGCLTWSYSVPDMGEKHCWELTLHAHSRS